MLPQPVFINGQGVPGRFGKRYTLFAFDLTPMRVTDRTSTGYKKAACESRCISLQRTVNVVIYGEFEMVLEIDKSRNVIYDS